MNPNQVSAELRRIASAINNSKNPSRELVLQDIRRVLASMDETAGMEHEAGIKEKLAGLAAAAAMLIGCGQRDQNAMALATASQAYIMNHEADCMGDSAKEKQCVKDVVDWAAETAVKKGLAAPGEKHPLDGAKLNHEGQYLVIEKSGKKAQIKVGE